MASDCDMPVVIAANDCQVKASAVAVLENSSPATTATKGHKGIKRLGMKMLGLKYPVVKNATAQIAVDLMRRVDPGRDRNQTHAAKARPKVKVRREN